MLCRGEARRELERAGGKESETLSCKKTLGGVFLLYPMGGTEGWKDGWKDRWKDGWTDGQMDRDT